MKKRYDFIFGIGEACSCIQALHKAKLQFNSYPFDWLFGTNFMGRCEILANRFERFVEQDDLEDIHKTNLDTHNLCEIYHNKYNDITFNHDFLVGHDLSETYTSVHEKYMRRISRLLNNIDNSKYVLIVYIETPVKNHAFVQDAELIKGLDIISRAFPNTNIDLLYFSNSNKKKEIINVSDNITRIFDNYKNKKSNLDYTVRNNILVKYLRKTKLILPLSVKIKRVSRNFAINIIPFKKIRHKLQRRYHVK